MQEAGRHERPHQEQKPTKKGRGRTAGSRTNKGVNNGTTEETNKDAGALRTMKSEAKKRTETLTKKNPPYNKETNTLAD